MQTTGPFLDAIDVSFPCPASWGKMHGDGPARFCGYCKKFVYDISQMTRVQAEALILEKEGSLCARYYRRADGRIVTRDCAPMPRVGVPYALVLVFAFIGIVSASILGYLGYQEREGPVRKVIDWFGPGPVLVQGGICPVAPPPMPGNPNNPVPPQQ